MRYHEPQPPASPAAVDRLEQRIGRALPPPYRNHLLQQDGGRMDNNDRYVHTVFSVCAVKPIASIFSRLDTFAGRVPAWLLPVARDEGGNLFALSLRDDDYGTVWFWDHEYEADEGEDPTEDNITQVGENWDRFIQSLNPVAG
jgi:cell wall assembly regulator SMI1